jgi:hypothetical protein
METEGVGYSVKEEGDSGSLHLELSINIEYVCGLSITNNLVILVFHLDLGLMPWILLFITSAYVHS